MRLPLALALSLAAAPLAAQDAPTPSDTSTNADTPGRGVRPRRQNDVISQEEIRENLSAGNLFVLIQRLRPIWLRQRAGREVDLDGSAFPVVRYNDRAIGNPEVMREINTADVISVRFYSSTIARSIFGTGYGRGAIVITGR